MRTVVIAALVGLALLGCESGTAPSPDLEGDYSLTAPTTDVVSGALVDVSGTLILRSEDYTISLTYTDSQTGGFLGTSQHSGSYSVTRADREYFHINFSDSERGLYRTGTDRISQRVGDARYDWDRVR